VATVIGTQEMIVVVEVVVEVVIEETTVDLQEMSVDVMIIVEMITEEMIVVVVQEIQDEANSALPETQIIVAWWKISLQIVVGKILKITSVRLVMSALPMSDMAVVMKLTLALWSSRD